MTSETNVAMPTSGGTAARSVAGNLSSSSATARQNGRELSRSRTRAQKPPPLSAKSGGRGEMPASRRRLASLRSSEAQRDIHRTERDPEPHIGDLLDEALAAKLALGGLEQNLRRPWGPGELGGRAHSPAPIVRRPLPLCMSIVNGALGSRTTPLMRGRP